MSIPEAAVDAAADWLPHSGDCEVRPGRDCTCRQPRVAIMRAALEDVAPHLLSREAAALAAVRAHGADRTKFTDTGNDKVDAAIRGYAYHVERVIAEVLNAPAEGGTWTMTDAEFQRERAEAWEAGLRHALTWLGLKQYADVMAKDNPHGKVGK